MGTPGFENHDNHAWWPTAVVPAPGRLSQEGLHEFKVSLGYLVRPSVQNSKVGKVAHCWHSPCPLPAVASKHLSVTHTSQGYSSGAQAPARQRKVPSSIPGTKKKEKKRDLTHVKAVSSVTIDIRQEASRVELCICPAGSFGTMQSSFRGHGQSLAGCVHRQSPRGQAWPCCPCR